METKNEIPQCAGKMKNCGKNKKRISFWLKF